MIKFLLLALTFGCFVFAGMMIAHNMVWQAFLLAAIAGFISGIRDKYLKNN